MKIRIITFLLFMAISSLSMAQTNDFGIWTSIGANKELGKWDLSAETELRTKENITAIDRWNIGLSAGYKIFKPVKIGGGYEFIFFNDSEYKDYQPRHRAYLFVQGKQKIGHFTFSLRERAQITAKDVTDRIKESGKIDNYKVNPEYIWRNKFKIEYNIPRLPVTPEASVETFYTLNNPDGNAFEQIRYTLSIEYKLSKKHKFEVYGMYDKEINSKDPVQNFVMGVGYIFSF